MRTILQFWYCYCKTRNEGNQRHCSSCGTSRIERHAQVHSSGRAVTYINPATGERRTPARADQPIPEVYARQGFERHEIMSMVEYEKATGLVHEASTFSPGNEPCPFKEPEIPKMSEALKKDLIDDLRNAKASGPWTDDG